MISSGLFLASTPNRIFGTRNGLDTWGFEDMPGGGDRDFIDLIVGIDFTSAAGHGWLV